MRNLFQEEMMMAVYSHLPQKQLKISCKCQENNQSTPTRQGRVTRAGFALRRAGVANPPVQDKLRPKWMQAHGGLRCEIKQRAAESTELWWADTGKLATCNTGTQELEQGTAAFTAWFR
ncbi:MAG: hypothetical protein MUF54_06745, partial [Polyangiaceae bacterium]|nr:hypothetical protein [Polyangiaceae bacterium]